MIKSNKTNGSNFEINFDNAKWLKAGDIVGQSFTIFHILKMSTKYGKKWGAVLTNAETSAENPTLIILPNSNQADFDEITNADIEAQNGLVVEMTKKTSKNGNEYYKFEW